MTYSCGKYLRGDYLSPNNRPTYGTKKSRAYLEIPAKEHSYPGTLDLRQISYPPFSKSSSPLSAQLLEACTWSGEGERDYPYSQNDEHINSSNEWSDEYSQISLLDRGTLKLSK